MVSHMPLPFVTAGHATPDKSENLLYQLQSTFASLELSDLRAHDPSPLTLALRDVDGTPMNTSIQMDVDEFFNILLDRLENLLRGSPSADAIFAGLLGGKVVQQIKSLECSHVSEREESFLALQCDVKEKRDVDEALRAYVKGEMLDGDNKYFCERCRKKVDAVKRCVFPPLTASFWSFWRFFAYFGAFLRFFLVSFM